MAPLFFFALSLLHAEEGMWPLNNVPTAKLQSQYGFTPTPQFLEHARLASVRLAYGCSGSFVSPNGLVMTNHHCAASCIDQLSTAEKNYTENGYYAAKGEAELKCPREEINVLTNITDVTKRISTKIAGMGDKEANDERKAEIARIEKECSTSDAVRCEVVSLYGGGIYDLYKYRRYQDIRLVFAPEKAIAFFGGDPDNFMFPRYDLDASFFRVYENGKPLKTEHYFPWSPKGSKEGDLTLVTGHPGTTNRLDTIAMLETDRDVVMPFTLMYLSEYRGMLAEFGARGEEQYRISEDTLFGVENSLKAYKGEFEALLQPSLMDQKRAEERDFQQRVAAKPELQKQYGQVWSDIAAAQQKFRQYTLPYRMWEGASGFQSDLFRQGRRLIRWAEESSKPNDKRLEEYAEARIPEVRQRILSEAPIYPELEIERLTFSLSKLREVLGVDDPSVRQIFGKRSPREIATETVKGSKLKDAAVRKALFEGGRKAIEASQDPMIVLARAVDPIARKVRKQFEDEVESTITLGQEKLARARFAVYGTSIYPDATFTLRLSYGSVKGWEENGKRVPPYTIIGGAYERATGRFPYALPESWIKAQPKLDLTTPFNMSTTNDIIGGNSGSPMFNRDGQIVGLIFDGNIHSLGGAFGFDPKLNRAVAVDSRAIVEALDKVYNARELLNEIKPAAR